MEQNRSETLYRMLAIMLHFIEIFTVPFLYIDPDKSGDDQPAVFPDVIQEFEHDLLVIGRTGPRGEDHVECRALFDADKVKECPGLRFSAQRMRGLYQVGEAYGVLAVFEQVDFPRIGIKVEPPA